MPIDITERYKLIFQQDNHASDFRVKIIQIWGLLYAGMTAAFIWLQAEAKPLSWIAPAAGALVTVLMWFADRRNCDAFVKWRRIGYELESNPAAGIPQEERFFDSKSNTSLWQKIRSIIKTHSFFISIFSLTMFVVLVWVTNYLRDSEGVLLVRGGVMKKYKIVEFKTSEEKLEDSLNEMARQGWVLRTIDHQSNREVMDLIFERDK